MPIHEIMNICGVKFHSIGSDELRAVIAERLRGPARNFTVVTPNVDFIMRAHRDPEFRVVLEKADLSLCDSAIVKSTSRLIGQSVKEKITGSDLLDIVCSSLSELTSCFVLGATQESVESAARNLEGKYPHVKVAGVRDGYFLPEDEAGVVDRINATGAKVLIVGMGSPRQELWVERNKSRLKAHVIICVGGVIDVLSGKARRSPKWMQNAGLEWFWRLAHEPGRLWKRYLIDDMQYFYLLLRQGIRRS